MKNSNVSAKSRGILLFAFNTKSIDYERIAQQAARLITHNLRLPGTIITDADVDNVFKNHKNLNQPEWRNGDRWRAYELSPYDETLLLDSDYLMLDDSLVKLFDQDFDYRLQHHNQMINEVNEFRMGIMGLPYVWATAILFRKTSRAKQLFDLVARIQRNYSYYGQLYHIAESNFRNDYAFAIANNLLNGYDLSIGNSVPWAMLTIDKNIKAIEIKNNNIIIRQHSHAHVLPRQNIHIIDKQYLLSADYDKFVDTVCQN